MHSEKSGMHADDVPAVSRIAGILRQARPRTLPRVVVPMANNPEVIGAIALAIQRRLAQFTLIGPKDEINRIAREAGAELSGAELMEETDAVLACGHAAAMAASGEAQVLMKGLVQTADFVRAILTPEYGLVPKAGLLSHVALCDVNGFDRLFLLSDAAITTYPDATQKKAIVENVLGCATAIGVRKPRVALVAPVENVSSRIPGTSQAAAVKEAFRGDPRLHVDGPFGLDVAISPEAARIKGIAGEVAGQADVLIMPNIDAGNVLYKALTGFVHARVAGVVAGARVPVVLTSRADSKQCKLLSLELALAVAPRRATR